MEGSERLLVRNLIRYTAIPCGLGLVAMAAIVLPGPGDQLSMTRLLVGCSMMIVFPLGMAYPLYPTDRKVGSTVAERKQALRPRRRTTAE
ncbi:hypothetical protein AB0B04_18960 [Streptomyces xinghaiensis]|uniref:Uncharacterized protein n=2 Tax=Streptomyces TaxID=1883 RepID=A0A3R7I2W1_9ACTN|nr:MULTISPECIES: hypothetical protein [Streptomyces]KNE83287.1 hypothetical protein ADZ36_05445 [Streptomyces fradiae]OFA36640.1 hypothetical protein BEN35_29735 [Streptomyces fradiae]PQM20638.1 hypothetical protein Sfr7A_25980 [Streptomyces xinghaiensis]RKM92579.1 hypothetical protein SFRA_024635 [Streptomyces xinghaiensis]RNC70547.1 hypothetical protein DC095_025625 [Streptomyces xinghaiensis]